MGDKTIKEITKILDNVGETKYKLQDRNKASFDIVDIVKQAFMFADMINETVEQNIKDVETLYKEIDKLNEEIEKLKVK